MTKLLLSPMRARKIAAALWQIGEQSLALQAGGNYAVPRKADGSPVIQIDRANNVELRNLFRRQRFGPQVLIVGEEDRQLLLPSAAVRAVVYVDPIDGTYQCAAGMKTGFTILSGVVEGSVPTSGFIVRPGDREVLFGGKDLGGLYRLADPAGQATVLPRRMARHGRLWGCDQAYVTHDPLLTRRYRAFIDARSEVAKKRGSADFYLSFPSGESLAQLLLGNYSFYINCAASPWDAAPAAALVPLIGGDMRYLSGEPIDWSKPSRELLRPYVVAESSAVAQEVCELWSQS